MTAQYTNRTCHCCGIRKPQPEMKRKEIWVETGKSQKEIGWDTTVSAMFGDKKAQRAIKDVNGGIGKRSYQRKKTVWLCENCSSPIKRVVKTSDDKSDNTFGFMFKAGCVLVILSVINAFFENVSKEKQIEDATSSFNAVDN